MFSLDLNEARTITPFFACPRYPTQDAANELKIRIGDSGSFYVAEMIDALDMLMAVMVGSGLGEISDTAQEVIRYVGRLVYHVQICCKRLTTSVGTPGR